MPRAMRVEYPGAIYHAMDRGERREDSLIIGRAKEAKAVLHRSRGGTQRHKPVPADELCAQLEFQSTVPSDGGANERPYCSGFNWMVTGAPHRSPR